jgi:hypothetical protein
MQKSVDVKDGIYELEKAVVHEIHERTRTNPVYVLIFSITQMAGSNIRAPN